MRGLIHLVKTNLKNSPYIIFLFGIILIPFQKSLELTYPGFFFGKFQDLQTTNVTISIILILVSSVFIILSKKKLKLELQQNWIVLLLIYLSINSLIQNLTFLFSSLSALATYLIITNLNKSQRLQTYQYFTYSIFFQSILVLYQLVFQSNTNLKLLTFLGEPVISESTKGISKIRFDEFSLLRPYGTTQSPNFLGYLFLASSIITQKLNPKTLPLITYLSSLTTLSLGAITANTIILLNNKNTKWVLLLITILGLIVLLRISDINYQSVTDRIALLKNFSINFIENLNFLTLILGDTNSSLIFYNNLKTLPWEIQPVHNSFIFLLQNFGLVGIFLLTKILINISRKSRLIASAVILIMLIDHYIFTNPNGLIIFVLISLLFEKIPDDQD